MCALPANYKRAGLQIGPNDVVRYDLVISSILLDQNMSFQMVKQTNDCYVNQEYSWIEECYLNTSMKFFCILPV